jgi:sec-independent protein translocase protein TatA
MSFFDAPWHIVLVLLAALLLFGSSRLPGAAKALGSSMNIFKKAVKGDDDDHQVTASTTTQAAAAPPQLTTGTAAPSQQAQIDDLQRQLNELQRQAADGGPAAPTTPAESQPNRQSY